MRREILCAISREAEGRLTGALKNLWAAYAAACWASSFALLHVAWAAGWYVGLPAQEARAAFQKSWFLIYDLIAAVLCVIGAAVALRLAPPKTNSTHWFLRLLAWCGTTILALRGTAGLVKVVYLVVLQIIFWSQGVGR